MRGDETTQSRSALLARWRDAAGVRDSAVAAPAPVETPVVAAALDAATLLEQLESELLRSVPRATADAVLRMLAPSRAAWSSEPNAESRAKMLAVLEQIEDVLDAVLLTGAAPDAGDREREGA
jgi:hypothetical protein